MPWKPVLFVIATVLMVTVVIEMGARLIYLIAHGQAFPREAVRLKIESINQKEYSLKESGDKQPILNEKSKWAVAAKQGIEHNEYVEVAHPYLGFVRDPGKNISVSGSNVISSFGFVDYNEPVVKRSPDTLNIAIFGGSFAQQTSMLAREALVDALQPLGKKVVIRNFAMASYKQPQQLMALAFVTALGAQFDVVINLDGFNEVALPVTDNIPYDIYPVYPRGWAQRVVNFATVDDLKSLGQIGELDRKRRSMAGWMSDWRLHNSVALTMVWDSLDRSLYRKRLLMAQEFEKVTAMAHKRFVGTGPAFEAPSEDELYQYLADVWKRCSIQMAHLATANGAVYIHFLQPNQYVAGTKPMSPEEEAQAIDPDNPYRTPVIKGYPQLMARGRDLIERGIDFHDLTGLFSREHGRVYADTCCHLNREGYALVAEVLAHMILKRSRGGA